MLGEKLRRYPTPFWRTYSYCTAVNVYVYAKDGASKKTETVQPLFSNNGTWRNARMWHAC